MANRMTSRRALALGVMACQHIADTSGGDVPDWQRAANTLRAMLRQYRPEVRYTVYTGPGMKYDAG